LKSSGSTLPLGQQSEDGCFCEAEEILRIVRTGKVHNLADEKRRTGSSVFTSMVTSIPKFTDPKTGVERQGVFLSSSGPTSLRSDTRVLWSALDEIHGRDSRIDLCDVLVVQTLPCGTEVTRPKRGRTVVNHDVFRILKIIEFDGVLHPTNSESRGREMESGKLDSPRQQIEDTSVKVKSPLREENKETHSEFARDHSSENIRHDSPVDQSPSMDTEQSSSPEPRVKLDKEETQCLENDCVEMDQDMELIPRIVECEQFENDQTNRKPSQTSNPRHESNQGRISGPMDVEEEEEVTSSYDHTKTRIRCVLHQKFRFPCNLIQRSLEGDDNKKVWVCRAESQCIQSKKEQVKVTCVVHDKTRHKKYMRLSTEGQWICQDQYSCFTSSLQFSSHNTRLTMEPLPETEFTRIHEVDYSVMTEVWTGDLCQCDPLGLSEALVVTQVKMRLLYHCLGQDPSNQDVVEHASPTIQDLMGEVEKLMISDTKSITELEWDSGPRTIHSICLVMSKGSSSATQDKVRELQEGLVTQSKIARLVMVTQSDSKIGWLIPHMSPLTSRFTLLPKVPMPVVVWWSD